MASINRQVHLARRPVGAPTPSDFVLVEAPEPSAGEGRVLAQNLLMSVDPYMRPRLDGEQPLGATLQAAGLARVLASDDSRFRPGNIVRHSEGFQERFAAPGDRLALLRRDPELPLSVYLHALGAPGLTAYGGMLDIAKLARRDRVFVSTAAGAVGSVAAQIARIRGCRVVGATGSEDKRAWLLDEAGLDEAINYRTAPIGPALAAATPDGLDVYFDNVGGDHLDAALARMRQGGRVAVCGMIGAYNGTSPPVTGLPAIIYGRITLRGFVSTDFAGLQAAFAADMRTWLKSGQIRYQETILDGIERTGEAMAGLFAGTNRGKMLVRIAD